MAELENQDPFALFGQWLKQAEEEEINDPNAMALATLGANGQPSLRMVLLKDHDENGFVFYTNLESRKGSELAQNHQVALLFHWKSLRRQVRIEGRVEAVSETEADQYFSTRPRMSQVGAWASKQSRPLAARYELEAEVAKQTIRFGISPIPRPPFWSGFRVKPHGFEFWQDGAFRMHDRWRFDLEVDEGDGEDSALRRKRGGKQEWVINRLFP